MAITADQQALLELLLQRGQGYDDIAGLLDVSEDEVRARARDTLTEIGGADPDRSVGLTDWVLGQADPIGRADAARHLREDADDHRLAAALIAELRELAPGASLPKLPPEPKQSRLARRSAARTTAPLPPPAPAGEPATASAPPTARRSVPALSERQTRLLLVGGLAAVLLLVVVLAVAGAFSGGDESATSASATTTNSTTDPGGQDIQTVKLQPEAGSDAQGAATFGIASGQQAYVDLDVANLQPAPSGKAYILWLMISDDQGHPLSPFQVNQDGTYHDQIPIASFLTQIAARTQSVNISLADRNPLLQKVSDAVKKGTPIIPYTGETIMTGAVTPTGQG